MTTPYFLKFLSFGIIKPCLEKEGIFCFEAEDLPIPQTKLQILILLKYTTNLNRFITKCLPKKPHQTLTPV